MILLVDAGNSRLKWACLQRGKRSKQFAEDYTQNTADTFVGQLLKHYNAQKSPNTRIRKIILVSVLGDTFTAKIQQTCQQFNIQLHIVRSQASAYGVTNAYEEPQRLGADRFVGLIAAHNLLKKQHRIIVSCGTAVTIDAMTVDGQHLGGLILPGLQSFSDNLIRKAALLTAPTASQTRLFAKNTADAIASGSVYGLVEAINGICSRMEGELRKMNDLGGSENSMYSVKKILCGGDAKTIHHYLSATTQREDDWLMQGLQVIAESTSEPVLE